MQLKVNVNKSHLKAVLKVMLEGALLVAAVGLGAMLGGAVWRAATTASRVGAAVQSWEDKGLHATRVWRAQAWLARQGWLGPMRPRSPLDPLVACGLPSGEAPGSCWWRLVLQPREAERLLACLTERVVEAEHDHNAFAARLCWGAALALLAAPLGLVAARRLACYTARALRGHQDRPTPARCEDASEAAADAREDFSETLLEKWATPDSGEPLEEWATPAAGVEAQKAMDDVAECEEATKGLEEMHDMVATAEGMKNEEVKKEGSGAADTVLYSSQATVEVEGVPDVLPVVDGSVPHNVAGKDAKWVLKKKKLKKLKYFGDVPVASGEAPAKAAVTDKAARRPTRPTAARQEVLNQARRGVQESWQEEVVTLQLPLPHARRQHVVGPRGDLIRQLRQNYPGVHVAVPPPQDTTSALVSLSGPRSQVAAAARDVAARLQAVEAQLYEAARRRQEANATAAVEVAPNMRRHVVGPGGEQLLRLAQQYPGVRVSVPPASDAESRSVIVRGPPAEVAAVQACIRARVEALERQRLLMRDRRQRRRPRVAPSAPRHL